MGLGTSEIIIDGRLYDQRSIRELQPLGHIDARDLGRAQIAGHFQRSSAFEHTRAVDGKYFIDEQLPPAAEPFDLADLAAAGTARLDDYRILCVDPGRIS